MKNQDSRTALRLPNEQRQRIDELVRKGQFKNLSAFVREAIEHFLKEVS